MARERGLTVDVAGFEKLMGATARARTQGPEEGGKSVSRSELQAAPRNSGIRFFGNRIGCGNMVTRKKPDELNMF